MEKRLKFCFKGDRDYIHGTDIVSTILNELSGKHLEEIDIKFSGVVKNGLTLVSGNDSDEAKVNISAKIENQEIAYQMVENEESIDCSYAYDEKLMLNKVKFDAKNQLASLSEVLDYTLCEKYVAMNKFLLMKSFPEAKGKWFFTRLELVNMNNIDGEIIVKLIKNFNYRLTKSDIYVGGSLLGNIYFTLKKDVT